MATEKKLKPGDHARDMGMRSYEGQDNEGHLSGSNQRHFNERRAQEAQRKEDRNELNRQDARGGVKGTEQEGR